MSYKILVSDPISEDGLAVLRSADDFVVDVKTGLTEDELCRIIPEYDAIVVRSQTQVTEKVIQAGKKLRIIGRAGVGLDNIDQQAATRRGIVVMNTPGGNTISTAELTIAMILALSRLIPQANASLRSGKWDRKSFKGVEIRGKTLAVLGMGRIGTEVARRARAFEMRVVAYDPYLSEEKAKQLGVEILPFDELLRQADYLTIHTPLNDETRNLIGREQLAKMKKGARIVNCARGGIVDEKALVEALDSGRIAGAAIDVYSQEPPADRALIDHPKTVCTPHLGASTEEAQSVVAVELAHQIVDALHGRGYRNAANMPFVDPKVMEELGPYIILGEKLGLLGAQLARGPVVKLHVDYLGEVRDYDVGPVTVSVLKGALTPHLDTIVNTVNAPFIAKERGLVYSETKSGEPVAYTSVISVTFQSKDKEINLWGTVFSGRQDFRIVRINGYHVDMKPFGWHLVVQNIDRPGFLGAIGTVLGKAGINIADMTLGRKEKGGRVVTAIAVDDPVPDALLQKIRKLEHVEDMTLVNLGD